MLRWILDTVHRIACCTCCRRKSASEKRTGVYQYLIARFACCRIPLPYSMLHIHSHIHICMLQAKICFGKADRRTQVPHSVLRMLPYTISLARFTYIHTCICCRRESASEKRTGVYHCSPRSPHRWCVRMWVWVVWVWVWAWLWVWCGIGLCFCLCLCV